MEAYVPETAQWLSALIAIGFGLLFAAALLGIAKALGPARISAEKLAPFECGSEPIGSPRVRFSVRFYQIAILFLVFDLETAFMYPWAVLFRKLSCKDGLYNAMSRTCVTGTSTVGLAAMAAFVTVLIVALAYVWRKRVIGWD